MNRKLLIVSYYWFPFSGTGVYRISKFVKYLRRRGWEPIILTAKESTGSLIESDIDPIYGTIPVYRTPIFEPADLFLSQSEDGGKGAVNPSVFYARNKNLLQRLAVWARLNVLIPDAKVSWRFLGVSTGKKVIREENPALILSTSPPPTAHLLAGKLARWSSLPWIADFRDPWTNIYYYDDVQLNPVARIINRFLEQSVLEQADAITVVNNGFFPDHDTNSKSRYIPNGYDPDDYPDSVPDRSSEQFTICYAGTLKENQYPSNLLEALRQLSEEDAGIAESLCFDFYGSVDPSFIEEMQQPEIRSESNFHGLIPHKQVIRKMAGADMQLLLIGKKPGSKTVLSTKVFEYMMTGKPILGIGPIDGSAAALIRKTGTGSFFSHRDAEGVKKYIRNAYTSWQNGRSIIESDREEIDRYHFENLTEQLEDVITDILKTSN